MFASVLDNLTCNAGLRAASDYDDHFTNLNSASTNYLFWRNTKLEILFIVSIEEVTEVEPKEIEKYQDIIEEASGNQHTRVGIVKEPSIDITCHSLSNQVRPNE